MSNKRKRIPPEVWLLGALLFLALARDFLANGRPLYCRIEGQNYYPGLRTVFEDPNRPYTDSVLEKLRQDDLWKTCRYEAAVFAPIPFSPGEWSSRITCDLQPPGTVHPQLSNRFRHWLGTDIQGRDVAAGLISGARIALLTASVAMAMAFGIGLVLGAIAGFFGDDRLRIRRGRLLALALGILPAYFAAFIALPQAYPGDLVAGWAAGLAVFTTLVLIFYWIGGWLSRLPVLSQTLVFPIDMLIMRLAEVFNSVPRLVVVFTLAALALRQSLWVLIALIGAMSWTGVARFIRAELLRIRELDYIAAARVMGFSEWRILWRHALPNALRPALVVFAIGAAGAIMLEASLSFLGFGGDSFRGVSWGSLLQTARERPEAWWVPLPPGLAIALTVLALHSWGERLSARQHSV